MQWPKRNLQPIDIQARVKDLVISLMTKQIIKLSKKVSNIRNLNSKICLLQELVKISWYKNLWCLGCFTQFSKIEAKIPKTYRFGRGRTIGNISYALILTGKGVLRDEQSIPIWQLTDGSVLCQHLGKAALKNTGIKYAERTVEERLLKAWKTFGPGGSGKL